MKSTVLYIDGENFRKNVGKALYTQGIKSESKSILKLDFNKLFSSALKGYKVDHKFYYAARLHQEKSTSKKSKELIKSQRILKTSLEKEEYEFVIAGNVRLQGKTFREKGVDVRIAVDMVSSAFRKEVSKIVLCSSDSDMQPAVKVVKDLGIEIVYLGFEINPNKGLTYTTDKTILFRNSEIVDSFAN